MNVMKLDVEDVTVFVKTKTNRKSLKQILNKDFIKQVLFISIPIMIQQVLITSFGLVDSFMVSSLDNNLSITAVGLCASIEMIVNCVLFGIGTGVSVFASQYFGAKDKNGMQKCFLLHLSLNLAFSLICCGCVYFFNEQILGIYMNKNSDPQIMALAKKYIKIACFSYIFASINHTFMHNYRIIKKSYIPLIVGIVALISNFSINLVLINGYLSFPKLGIAGAAYGTLLSSMISVSVYVAITFITKQPFLGKISIIKQSYQKDFFIKVLRKMLPLVLNELLFGIGLSMYSKLFMYTEKQYPSYIMADKVAMVFFNTTFGINNAASVLMGAELGKGNIENTKDYRKGFLALALIYGSFVAIIMCIFGPSLLSVYDKPTKLAVYILYLYTIKILLRSVNVINLATLRVGGDSKFIFFIDCGLQWLVGILLGFILVVGFNVTNILIVFAVMQIEQVVRLIGMTIRINKDKWANILIERNT